MQSHEVNILKGRQPTSLWVCKGQGQCLLQKETVFLLCFVTSPRFLPQGAQLTVCLMKSVSTRLCPPGDHGQTSSSD
jgi:hypothetical protein